jgi:hypothetical protein
MLTMNDSFLGMDYQNIRSDPVDRPVDRVDQVDPASAFSGDNIKIPSKCLMKFR